MGANRDWQKILSIGYGYVLIAGHFNTDGAGAVTTQIPATSEGAPFTITKPAGTGVYRVTLADVFYRIIASIPSLMKVAGTLDAKIDGNTQTASTQIVDFQVHKSSDGTALDLVSGKVNFVIIAKKNTVMP